MSITCKKCASDRYVKNGFNNGKQRYKCKNCGCNFTVGDRRTSPQTAAKKALCVLFYGLGKASFTMLGKLFGHSPSVIYRWIKEAGLALPDEEIPNNIKEIEFDEMWHFLGKKNENFGSSRPWTALRAEPSPGLQAVVMLRRSDNYITKSDT